MNNVPQRYGFLLLSNFTHIGFAAASEPLRMANMATGKVLYDIHTLSQDGAVVVASSGVQVLPDAALAAAPALDALFVIGSNPMIHSGDRAVLKWLRYQASRGVALGGVCTGSYTLARAGLLDDYRCTIHWEDMAQFIERFPKIIISPSTTPTSGKPAGNPTSASNAG
jgi:AraC family transcriptional regulator, glycine betaine-responsive activator